MTFEGNGSVNQTFYSMTNMVFDTTRIDMMFVAIVATVFFVALV